MFHHTYVDMLTHWIQQTEENIAKHYILKQVLQFRILTLCITIMVYAALLYRFI